MIVMKQIIKKGRYDTPPGIEMAVKNALARLPQRRHARLAVLPRRIALAACAAILICGIAVASIPSARAYAESLLRSVFKLYAGEPDNGIITAPGVSETSTFEQKEQSKYSILAANSVPVNVSQTSNGVTATVLEAAIADNRLFLGFEFTGLPQHCYPGEESIHIWVDGKLINTGRTRRSTSTSGSDVFTVDHPLTITQENLPDNFTVRLSFSLRQFPDGGHGQGNVIASFDMSFNMDKPAVFATLPPGSVDGMTKDEGSDKGLSITGSPKHEGMSPQDDPNLIEPKGVTDWVKYENSQAAVSFEYPKVWAQINAPWPLKSNGAVLSAYKGSGGGVIVYAVQLDAAKPTEAADFVTAYLLKEGAEGRGYDVKGGQVYFINDTSGRYLDQSYDSYIIVKLSDPISVDSNTYNYLLIWAPMDYSAHILKTLVIN